MTSALSAEERLAYAASFADTLAKGGAAWLEGSRRAAFAAFVERGWPSRAEEDWRFTDPTPVQARMQPATALAGLTGLIFDAQLLELGRGRGQRLAFLDGRRLPELTASQSASVTPITGSLALVLAEEGGQAASLFGAQATRASTFVALNTAFLGDGAFVRIPAGLRLTDPIFLLYLAAADGGASHVRTLVHAEADSQATVIEVHLGADGRATLSNAVTEVVVEAGAHLAYHGVVKASPTGFHIGHLAVTQRAGSTFTAHTLALAGRLVRSDVHVVLAESDCTCELDGLHLVGSGSHVDHQTSVEHRAPRCRSRESSRSVVADRGQAVWSGRAVVRPAARGTDARQENRNLLLADGAVAHAKPHLEIFTSDVKCSHGATSGRLDGEAMFYLRSRGIGDREARQMLIAAFLRTGLATVADASLRGELEAIVASRSHDLLGAGGGA
jgi:Fe-S cluster assembly protein SufD